MKAFTILALLPFVASKPNIGAPIAHGAVHHAAPLHHAPAAGYGHPAPAPAYGHPAPAPAYGHPSPAPSYGHPAPAPAYGHPAPAPAPGYGHPAPAPAYGHPAPAPSYGHPAPAYGHPAPQYGPTHNCSVIDVVEVAETCTPTIATECNNVALPVKLIEDIDFTYIVTRTVCTESIQEIPQEVCVYKYNQKTEDTTAKTVEVTFEKVTDVQMVTVCQPGPAGYGHGGYGGYGHNYCKEVAQETAYNVPVVTPVDIDVTVAYPEPEKVCVDKPISLPVVSCNDISEERTIKVPTVVDSEVIVAMCIAKIGEPDCQNVELTLPKQRCIELAYGHAHEVAHAPEPYAPAPHA